MGQAIGSALALLFGARQVRILMIGLDCAGKTTILYKLRLGEVVATSPTVGFNMEVVELANVAFTIWDVGGQDKLRQFWRAYWQNTDGVVFVVDASDRGRVRQARQEIEAMMSIDGLRHAVLLVFANKQDVSNAMSTTEVTEQLDLRSLRQHWFVQGCSATTGQGLHEGFEWMATHTTMLSR
jgi:ADP-ribosylation factor 1/2